MKLIKLITILLIYILIILIVIKIHYKQFDYFTTNYGYRCEPCRECEAGQYLNGCSGTNAGSCDDIYYVNGNLHVANSGATTSSQSLAQYCITNQNSNKCGDCNTRARTCNDTQYLSGCGVDGNRGECLDCTCPDGEYISGCGGLEPGFCEPCNTLICEVGKYLTGCSGTEPGECTNCPINSISNSGSTAQTDCLCNAGYSGPDGGPCTICLAGFYKTIVGNGSCQPCEAGKYKANTGEGTCDPCGDNKYQNNMGESSCIDCPINSTSPPESDSVEDCKCNAGYSGPDGGPCTICPAGFYKTDVGNGSCQPCEAGKYKETTGEGTCRPCGDNKYQNNMGESSCIDCPINSTSPPESDSVEDCKCNAGYGMDGSQCTICPAGKYKTDVGNGSCQPCEAGKYKANTGEGTCTPCNENMSSPVGSDSVEDCVCDKGYELINGVCTECQEGKYKDTIGNHTCTLCSSNHSPSEQYYHNCGGDSKGELTDCAYDSCESDEYLHGCGKSNSGICKKCNTAYRWEGRTYGRTYYYPSCGGDGKLGEATQCSEYSRSNNCSNNQYFWGCFGENDGACYSCVDRCSQGEVAIGCGNGNMGRCESCIDRQEDYCSDRSDGRTTLYNCGGNRVGYCGCPDGMYWAGRAGVCRWRNW